MAVRNQGRRRRLLQRGCLRRLGAVAAFTLLACAAQAAPSWGATFNVNSTSDETDMAPGNGRCASLAFGCTLRAAIQEANARPGPDAINLPAGNYELEIPPLNLNDITNGDLDITEALRITGAGAASTIVDGGVPKAGSPPEARGLDRLFDVQAPSGSVRLTGLTIRDGYAAEHGGGLLNADGATVRLANVTMTGNFAGETGGAVDNHAGGAVQVTGSNISGNAANQSGSALNNNRGGVLSVSTTTVSQNSAAVVGQNPSLTGAGAVANNAELDAKGTITVTSSTISDNDAGGSANNGSAISNDGAGTVTVAASSILRNSTEGDGGAVYNGSGEVTVRGTKLSENVADNGGAIYSSVSGSGRLVVENSTISLNQARARGGGVSGNGTGDVSLTNVTLSRNRAQDWGGGVVNDDKAAVAIAGSRFSGNSALSGGGLANEGTGPVTVADSTFTNNRAALDGGGLHTNSVDEVSVTGGSFTLNKAQNGGGLSNEGGGVVRVAGTTFSRNTAQEEGGGVLIQSGDVRLNDLDVLDNVANSTVQGGGGISFQGDKTVSVGESAAIENSLIRGNKASLVGGGIDSRGDGPLDINDTTIESNSAKVGGGLHHLGDAPLEITRSTLATNSSEGGGGLFTDGDGEATLENSTISTNQASQFGGGLLVESRLTARSTTITGNSAPSGGGINNGGSDPVGDGFVFLRNTIVAGNPIGGNCVGTINSLGGNIDSADTCRFRELSDQNNTDPLLGPLADNGGLTRTHSLTAGSPAQDAAVHTLSEPCPPTDQRGALRPHGPGCDSGAYESELEPTPPPPSDCVERVERLVLADSDSWIAQGAPSNNFGTDSILKIRSQSGGSSRALVHFEIPTPPAGCKLVGAKLRLHASSATNGRTLEALRVASSWAEADVNWGNQPAVGGAAATASSGLGYVEWGVRDQVQEMYDGENHGFLIRDAAEDGPANEQGFHSREKDTESPPELILIFDDPNRPPPPPPECTGTSQVTAAADSDGWISQSSPATNFGNDSVLKVKSHSAGNSRALLSFALPGIPPECVVTNATLRLYASSFKDGRTIEAHQVASAWSETDVTWSNQPGTTGAAATAASASGWVEWPVTAQVQSMYAGANHGFLIRDAVEDGLALEQGFHSREKATDNPPELVIQFGPP